MNLQGAPPKHPPPHFLGRCLLSLGVLSLILQFEQHWLTCVTVVAQSNVLALIEVHPMVLVQDKLGQSSELSLFISAVTW